jgi:hypothetical protein
MQIRPCHTVRVTSCVLATMLSHFVCCRALCPCFSILNIPSLTPELSDNFTDFLVAPGMMLMPPANATFVPYQLNETLFFCVSDAMSNTTGVCLGMFPAPQGTNCSVRDGYITTVSIVLLQQFIISDSQYVCCTAVASAARPARCCHGRAAARA